MKYKFYMAFISVFTCIEQISGSQSNSSQKQYKEVTLEESENLESLVSEWNDRRQALTDYHKDYMEQFLKNNESFKVQMKVLPLKNSVSEIFPNDTNELSRNTNEIITHQMMELILEKKNKFSKCHTDYTEICYSLQPSFYTIVCIFALANFAFFTAGLLTEKNNFCLIEATINLTITILFTLINCLSYYLIKKIFFLEGKNNQYILLDHINRTIYEQSLKKNKNRYLYKLSKILTPQVNTFLSFIYFFYSIIKGLAAVGLIDQPEIININKIEEQTEISAFLLGIDIIIEFICLIFNILFWCSIKSFRCLKDHLFTTLTVSYGSQNLSFINKFIASLI